MMICLLLGGCGNLNQSTIGVLERCKIINSTITETSISANKEFFTITFENGLFYCEDNTSGGTLYIIKIPNECNIDMYSIIKSISSNFTEEKFDKLETDGEVSFYKAYRDALYCSKTKEGNTIKYVIR